MKGGSWEEHAAEKEGEKGREPANDGPSSSKREGRDRRRGMMAPGHGAGRGSSVA